MVDVVDRARRRPSSCSTRAAARRAGRPTRRSSAWPRSWPATAQSLDVEPPTRWALESALPMQYRTHRNNALALLALLCACPPGEPDPVTCAEWLQCYDGCGSWLEADPGAAIPNCDSTCRVSTGHRLEAPPVEFDPGSPLPFAPAAAIVFTELGAASLEEPTDQAGRFEQSLQARTECVTSSSRADGGTASVDAL